MATSLYPAKVHVMANHIVRCLKAYRTRFAVPNGCPPLFVGVQGPQGCGKTFLTSRLCSLLALPPYHISATVLSIDDFYLPHSRLQALAETHPQNRLLHGRGQPGTHDIELGGAVLQALKAINGSDGEVALPVFDKSLFNGEGDRAPESRIVRGPLDVILLEGWCVGFYPAQRAVIEARWCEPVPGLDNFDMQTFVALDDVLVINELLARYVEWWKVLETFVQIRGPPESPLGIIYQWRLQQEHDMKAKNGGRGMTDAQVKTFVDRYIPGYVFFGEQVGTGTTDENKGSLPPWHGHGLVLELDSERELLGTSQF